MGSAWLGDLELASGLSELSFPSAEWEEPFLSSQDFVDVRTSCKCQWAL